MDLQKLFEKANDLRNNAKTEDAVKLYQRVIGQALQQNDRHMAAEVTQMIGSAYYISGQYEKAEDYLLEALEKFKQLNDNGGQGAVLRDLGLNEAKLKNFESAKEYFHNSIYQLKQTDKLGHLGISQVKLGNLYGELGEIEKAEALILEGLDNIVKSPDRFFESTGYLDLAKLQEKMGKKDEAKNSTQKALQILDKISNKEQFQPRKKEIEKFLKEL